jgi:hypothetical protein
MQIVAGTALMAGLGLAALYIPPIGHAETQRAQVIRFLGVTVVVRSILNRPDKERWANWSSGGSNERTSMASW